jgi:protein-disulfide isomerase
MNRSSYGGGSALILLAALAAASLPSSSSAQELRQITTAGQRAILAPPEIELAGARDADVTIVEYFDYNCPYCKRIDPTFRQLLAEDKRIALIYKDWPIFGDISVYAARCALAAQWQGKYFVAHDALLGAAPFDQTSQVESVLRDAGIDVGRLKRDLISHAEEISAALARNSAEARALELQGTPGILVGRLLMPGGADIGFFKKLIAQIRTEPR